MIAHTHWDRSWYWPLERFRVKLVECVKAVIRELKARPDYRFQFDGQTLMLEDYLEICPEDRPFLQQCARDGRIQIGPMYCLADLYCTGGEALIRNIQIAKRWCDRFDGGFSSVLHMPDTFGIVPCIPMIAAGFGFKAFSFMRGVAGEMPGLTDMVSLAGIESQLPAGTRFFRWRSADGSEILTIRLREGYASAAPTRFLDGDTREVDHGRYVKRLRTAAAEWDLPAHDVILLMAGVDHMIPWEGQSAAMADASKEGRYRFAFSDLDAVADHLRGTDLSALPVCQTEFHGHGAASVLGGTVSARIYLKQANADIEQLLVNQVEPGAAMADLFGPSGATTSLIEHAWKMLLATHPHDDICGCSVDSVHRKNESDMQQARESADAIRRDVFGRLMDHYGANLRGDRRLSFACINTQAVPHTGPTRVRLDFEGQWQWGDVALPASYRIVNEEGHAVAFRERLRGQSTEHPRRVIEIDLFAKLPPFSPQRFYVEPTSEPMAKDVASLTAENDCLAVTLHANGTFDLTDRRTGQTHRRLGVLSSQGDIGDTYDFADLPDETETIFDTVDCRCTKRLWPSGLIELTAEGEIELPASTNPATRTRSENMVVLPFRQTLLLGPESEALEVDFHFTNTAADHRLRWNLPLAQPAETSLAGLKFSVIERPVGQRPAGMEAPRVFPEHPADHFIAAGGLACFSRFPINTEIIDESGQQRLAIAVCRSVSYLTNPHQGTTRKGTDAGPHTLTPDARCIGRSFDVRFALRPYAPTERGSLLHAAALWRSQPLVGQCDPTRPYPWRQEQTDEAALIETDSPIVVSALTPTFDGGVVLRLFNASDQPCTADIRHRFVGDPEPVSMAGEPIMSDRRPAPAGTLRVAMPPFALRNFRWRPAADDDTHASWLAPGESI